MNKISGKELNLLKTLEILKSNRFVSFYHFNNLSKREWDTIKQKLRKIETQDIPVNERQEGGKKKEGRTQVLPLSNLLLERTPLVQSKDKQYIMNNKGVTTKRKLKGAEVELLVLKSKAVVKALYPFLFYSQSCQGVEQTADTCAPALPPVALHQVAEQSRRNLLLDPLRASVPTRLLPASWPFLALRSHGTSNKLLQQTLVGTKQEEMVLNTIYSLLLEKIYCQANNQLEFTLNPTPAARINSLINAFYLIEGPTLLVGASTIKGFKESARQLEKEKSLVFVGGVLENQFINHLDLKDCLKTFLPTSTNLLQTLNYPLMIPPLNYYSNKLLFLLQKRQESLKKEEL